MMIERFWFLQSSLQVFLSKTSSASSSDRSQLQGLPDQFFSSNLERKLCFDFILLYHQFAVFNWFFPAGLRPAKIRVIESATVEWGWALRHHPVSVFNTPLGGRFRAFSGEVTSVSGQRPGLPQAASNQAMAASTSSVNYRLWSIQTLRLPGFCLNSLIQTGGSSPLRAAPFLQMMLHTSTRDTSDTLVNDLDSS
jgi:hypothetical protein